MHTYSTYIFTAIHLCVVNYCVPVYWLSQIFTFQISNAINWNFSKFLALKWAINIKKKQQLQICNIASWWIHVRACANLLVANTCLNRWFILPVYTLAKLKENHSSVNRHVCVYVVWFSCATAQWLIGREIFSLFYMRQFDQFGLFCLQIKKVHWFIIQFVTFFISYIKYFILFYQRIETIFL